MPWPIYSVAGGATFFPGAVLLALAAALGLLRPRRWIRYAVAIAVILGVALVIVSAEALPFWLDGVWAISVLAWMFRRSVTRRREAVAIGIAMLAVTAAAMGVGISYRICPSLPEADFPRLYVIGDSISAGLGEKGEIAWPALIAQEHHAQVIDLSRAGSTIADAERRLQSAPLAAGIVLIELGGNDMLGKVDPQRFENDLDALARTVQGGGRTVVMLELPLYPFGNPYGIAQRRIASRYHIVLIPRQYFAAVLAGPGATSDGVHLTQAGQQAMAALIWRVVGRAVGGHSAGKSPHSG